MTDAGGGFYSARTPQRGRRGRFFLWTPAQLREVLGDDAEVVGRFFGVTDGGNFEARNILNVPMSQERFVAQHNLDAANFDNLLKASKRELYEAREARVHPGRDDKVLTAWNGLMLRAFAEAAMAFDDDAYRAAAVHNADFLLNTMRPDGRLLRTWKREGVTGRARLNGYLEDYAFLADGLLALYQATFTDRYLRSAIELAEQMIDLFWDEEAQGFYDTGRDHETLITRPRDLFDNATPAGSSVAADVLLRLALICDRPDFEERAVTCLRAIAPVIDRATTAFGRSLAALDSRLDTGSWPSFGPKRSRPTRPSPSSTSCALPTPRTCCSSAAPQARSTTRRCCWTTARRCRARLPPTCVRNTSARRQLRTLESWQPDCRRSWARFSFEAA